MTSARALPPEAPTQLRLVGAALGDPTDPRTASGAAYYLLAALARRYELIGTIDYAPDGLAALAVAAGSFHPSRQRWQERYHLNRAAHRIRSHKLHRALDAQEHPFDLAVLVFGWARPWRGPYVIYVDHTWRMMEEHWPQKLPPRNALESLLAAERAAFLGARHVFTMSEAAAVSLIDDYRLRDDRVTPVGGGVNFDVLPEIAPAEGSRRILFVGREFARKGGDVLVSAFGRVRERVPDAGLVIAGVGPEEAGTAPGVEALGDVAGRANLARLYADAAVFCLPSLYEPYGLSLVEAMAHGLPCIAARGVAAHEIVGEGTTGLLVEPDDPDSLYEALAYLLEHPEEAAAMGRAGRRRVETELNWDRVVERMEPGLCAAVE